MAATVRLEDENKKRAQELEATRAKLDEAEIAVKKSKEEVHLVRKTSDGLIAEQASKVDAVAALLTAEQLRSKKAEGKALQLEAALAELRGKLTTAQGGLCHTI